jgi:defect-in-organelle-trafficking protein DotD
MRYFLLLALMLTSLTGCGNRAEADKVEPVAPMIVSDKTALLEAAQAISQSLSDLKALEKASHPVAQQKFLPYPKHHSMKEIVSVEWSGPLEPLLQSIAKQHRYQFRVIGRIPAIPVLVTISARNTPLAYIIRNADVQAGTKANIFVYPEPGIRTIELRYV